MANKTAFKTIIINDTFGCKNMSALSLCQLSSPPPPLPAETDLIYVAKYCGKTVHKLTVIKQTPAPAPAPAACWLILIYGQLKLESNFLAINKTSSKEIVFVCLRDASCKLLVGRPNKKDVEYFGSGQNLTIPPGELVLTLKVSVPMIGLAGNKWLPWATNQIWIPHLKTVINRRKLSDWKTINCEAWRVFHDSTSSGERFLLLIWLDVWQKV